MWAWLEIRQLYLDANSWKGSETHKWVIHNMKYDIFMPLVALESLSITTNMQHIASIASYCIKHAAYNHKSEHATHLIHTNTVCTLNN